MNRSVRNEQALARLAAVSAVLAVLGCAGAGGAGAGTAQRAATARAQPGVVSGGTFKPSAPAAASYGPDASRVCQTSRAFQTVLDELAATATRAGKPAPAPDGRLCAVAEAFLGWDLAAKVRPAVLEFASQHFGLVSTVQPPIVAIIQTDDPKEISDRVVQAVGTPLLNAVRPLVGLATVVVQRGDRRSGLASKTKLAVAIIDGAVDVDPVPRRLEAGQQAMLTGRFEGELSSPKVTVGDPTGQVATAENPGGKDFKVEVKCGEKPGIIRVEIRGERAGQSGPLASFPIGCAAALPASVAVAAEPWPTDLAQQERKALDVVNRERSAAGLAPLVWDDAVAQVARAIAQSLKGGGTGADVRERLKEGGIASPVVLQSLAADRSAERAQERLMQSPTNRANMLNAEITNAGIGLFVTSDAGNAPLVYLAETFIKELPPVDVAQARAKLRDAVAQKRKDARTTAVESDPALEEVAQKYAEALAAGAGTVSKEAGDAITAPLNAAFKAVAMVSGAKQDPLDFAEEPQVVSPGRSLGVGVALGKNAVLGRNATYVVIMVGAPRVEAKAAKPKAKAKK